MFVGRGCLWGEGPTRSKPFRRGGGELSRASPKCLHDRGGSQGTHVDWGGRRGRCNRLAVNPFGPEVMRHHQVRVMVRNGFKSRRPRIVLCHFKLESSCGPRRAGVEPYSGCLFTAYASEAPTPRKLCSRLDPRPLAARPEPPDPEWRFFKCSRVAHFRVWYERRSKSAAGVGRKVPRFSTGVYKFVDPYFVAWPHAALGDADAAFAWLDKAYDDHSDWLAALKVDPLLDRLRADARFVELLKRMRLPI